MKQHSFLLKIDNPCGEDWNSMTQTDIGKFCSHCSKTVVDISNLSDSEVIQIVEKSSAKFCARLSRQQLNRSFERDQPSKSFGIYKLIAGLAMIGTAQNSIASYKSFDRLKAFSFTETKELLTQKHEEGKEAPKDSLGKNVRGKVIDSHTKEPLAFAFVNVKGFKSGASTDLDGNFKIVIPDSVMKEKITLVVASIGYETKEVIIDKKDMSTATEILIQAEEVSTTGEVCIIRIRKKWWQIWK